MFYYEKQYVYEKNMLKKFIYTRRGLQFDVLLSAYQVYGDRLDNEIEKLIDDEHIDNYKRNNFGDIYYVIVYNNKRLSVYSMDDAYGVFT